MIQWDLIEDREIAEKVKNEAVEFVAKCHFGCQGIEKTKDDTINAVNRLKSSGFKVKAFDTEMNYVELCKELLQGLVPLHAAVSYPMGRMLLANKLNDLETIYNLGVTDTCVCLDWQAIFSKRYSDIEKEAAIIFNRFGKIFDYLAFVVPATLMSDTQIIETCKALDQAGIVSVKVNPGAKLWVSFEEVELIQRVFPGRFDIHPSGGIRKLEEVEKYLELGCKVIHTVSSLDIAEELIERQLLKYGGIKNVG